MDFAGVSITTLTTPTEGSTEYAEPIAQGRILDKNNNTENNSKYKRLKTFCIKVFKSMFYYHYYYLLPYMKYKANRL